MAEQKALIVGISGCSSSGKTTLARLLRDIFPEAFILHEDDFYKTDEDIPVKNGLQDWDCIEALSVPDMEQSLQHIRSNGTFPPTLESKEDQNSVGQCPVSDAKIAAAKARVHWWLQPGQPGHDIFISNKSPRKICLLDGFLLYSRDLAGVMDLIDIKLFLLVSHAKATQRREARDGYVTLEGFWKDPPGYVDKIVWPNYAKAHAWLFKDGDVEGELDERVVVSKGIKAQMGKGSDIDMDTTLEWAVETVILELERLR